MILPECIIREQEAASEKTPSERLVELAQYSIELARLVANNPNAPAEVLKELGMSTDVATRHLVATNPNTPWELLIELLNEFPKAVLSNPRFPLLCAESSQLLHRIPLSTLHLIVRLNIAPKSLLHWVENHADPEILAMLQPNFSAH